MTIASPPPASALLTYEQYMAEEEIVARYNIIDGSRTFMPGANWPHQRIGGNIEEAFRIFERATGTGYALSAPYDVLIRRNPLRARQPDVLFISHTRLQQGGGIPQRGPLQVPPEIVVEILSDSDTRRMIGDKLADYAAIGVEEGWLARPDERTVEVVRLTIGGPVSVATYDDTQIAQSFTFPNLTLAVSDIFRP